MDMIKTAAIFAAISVIFAFNLRLYTEGQSVLLSVAKEPDGWNLKCGYYPPFRVSYVKRPVQTGCSEYAPAQ